MASRSALHRALCAFVLTLAANGPAGAADLATLPAVRSHCTQDLTSAPIPGFTAADLQVEPVLSYPSTALANWSEGWVLLEFAVTNQGVPRNITVIDAIGPKEFVETSIRAAEKARFKPATRNGKPVDQFLARFSIKFLFSDQSREADHASFLRSYNKARNLLRNKEVDGAISTLEDAFRSRLNLYEAAMGSYLLTIAYGQKQMWDRAAFHARHATIEDGAYLERTARPDAYAHQVELEARVGNYVGALCAFEDLKKIEKDPTTTRPELSRAVDAVSKAVNGQAPLATDGTLNVHQLSGGPATWRRALLRPKFYFNDIKGDVKALHLACMGTEFDAAVDNEMQWNVPPAAGACVLTVTGAPGAAFTLVEDW